MNKVFVLNASPIILLGKAGLLRTLNLGGCYNKREPSNVPGAKKMDHEIVFIVKESEEGGYEAKALGHSIFTDADSFEELRVMVKDAVACHFDPGKGPKIIRLHYVRDEVIAA